MDLAGFGCDRLPIAIAAAGALLHYVQDTQCGALPHIGSLFTEEQGDGIVLDAASRRNLELEHTMSGKTDNTLLHVLYDTVTVMGSRCLRPWINQPLRNCETLKFHHGALASFRETRAYEDVREALHGVRDIQQSWRESR